MDPAKSYRLPGDIGGPMNIGEGYRWNVPVITYGFERSFLDYFGSNGVAAVEGAIQILNQLPPASLINLTNYPTDVWRYNFQAQAAGLWDLKSVTLGLLLEQFGLASPERFVFCIRDFDPSTVDGWSLVIQRNFDSATVQPSQYVNDTLVSYVITRYGSSTNITQVDAVEFPVDPTAIFPSSVVGLPVQTGQYATSLSRDDVGGLRYLLNGNQIRYEPLLPDVAAVTGTNLVRWAYRPGIEKVLLLRHSAGALSGQFNAFTNQWTDVYYADDGPAYQEVERITTKPDIVFRAGDLGFAAFERTSTTNWMNNADLHGNPGGAGPGVIQPPISITLNNAGPMRFNYGPFNGDEVTGLRINAWGSFDGNTNQLITFPTGQLPFSPTIIHFKLVVAGRTNNFQWPAGAAAYGRFSFQMSTNLTDWKTLARATNSGAVFSQTFLGTATEAARYFRALPE